MNNIVISGRLARDAELRKTTGGNSVATATVAVDGFKDGEKYADFFTVVAWGKTAERLAKYGQKGTQVEVCGRMNSRVYQAKDGTNRTAWEINASNIEIHLPPKAKAKEQASPDIDPTDLPF